MKLSYKKLDTYISFQNNLNEGMLVKDLLGISNQKFFQKSHTNTIGIDLSTYRVVRKNQFAFNRATTRNGDKISIALRQGDDCIVSPSYRVFKVIDESKLLSEYLLMWFKRPEFDRYARFKSHGSAHEFFEEDQMRGVELPIPSITKQREIVNEYNTINDRLDLSENLINALEKVIYATYRQWFIDFEFPDSNKFSYKTNHGSMIYNEQLKTEIPVGWIVKRIGDLVACNNSSLSSNDGTKIISYLDTSSITNNEIDDLQIFDISKDAIPSRAKRKVFHDDIIFSTVRPNLRHFGILKNPNKNLIVSTGFAVLTPIHKNIFSEFIYLFLTNNSMLERLQSKAEMSVSTYPSINADDLLDLYICLPTEELLINAEPIFRSLFEYCDFLKKEKKLLKNMRDLLFSRLATIEEH